VVDLHQERADIEGITRAEATARSFALIPIDPEFPKKKDKDAMHLLYKALHEHVLEEEEGE
jgi:hypothetical protein